MAAPWQALSTPGRRHWQLPQLSARWYHLAGGGTRHCFLSRRKSLADVQSTDHINIRRYKQTTSLSAEDTTPNFNRNVWLQGRGKQVLHLSHGSRTRMPWKFQTVHTFWHSGLNNLLHLNKHLHSLPYWRALNWRTRVRTHTQGSSESQISQLEVW